MSSIWMLGRVWSPPNTVMRPLVKACIVSMLTDTSSRMPRRVSADGGGAHDLHHHVVPVGQHDALAAHLGLVVFGDRQQLEVLGDLLLVLDAVDAAGGGVDEALDALALRAVGKLHGREAADLPGQLRIEIAAGIIRHAATDG